MARWKVLKTDSLFKTPFFEMKVDQCELPDGRIMPKYYVLNFLDWVNVVPVTKDGQMVLLEQYRHAAQDTFLEVPGGSLNPPKDGAEMEDPQKAGERELLEETGYSGGEWTYCGFHFPNPALQSNKLHTFLVKGCEKVAEPSLDPYEDLKVITMPVADAVEAWREGRFTHSLIAASFARAIHMATAAR